MRHARKDYDRFQDPAVDDASLLGEGSTPIAPDEPVFLLRAQDRHAAKVVAFYAGMLESDPEVDPMMAAVCKRWSNEMAVWASQKTPDMPEQDGCRICNSAPTKFFDGVGGARGLYCWEHYPGRS